MSSYTLIEGEKDIVSNATVISYIPNAHKYGSISIKSILFLDSGGNVIVPTTGSLLAFEIPDAEQLTIKGHWPWTSQNSAEWFDTISIAQYNSNLGHFFTYNSPPDFVGVTFVGINAEVTSIKVRWTANK